MKTVELTDSDSILKSSVIKQIGWELAQGRVHTILDLETNRTDSKNHQTFKQRLRQTSTTQDEKRKKKPVRLNTTLLTASVTSRTGCCTDLFLTYNKNHQNCGKCFRVVFLPEKLQWHLYISILVLYTRVQMKKTSCSMLQPLQHHVNVNKRNKLKEIFRHLLSCFLAHHNRTKLTMITNQDELNTTKKPMIVNKTVQNISCPFTGPTKQLEFCLKQQCSNRNWHLKEVYSLKKNKKKHVFDPTIISMI